jgi:hypothetical protein
MGKLRYTIFTKFYEIDGYLLVTSPPSYVYGSLHYADIVIRYEFDLLPGKFAAFVTYHIFHIFLSTISSKSNSMFFSSNL